MTWLAMLLLQQVERQYLHLYQEREKRETLHLFQPPRADQMPDPRQGQRHNILPSIP